jgi:hypothetical protein
MLPSPTPLDTRLIELWRTSPAQKTPGRLVSNGNGARSSFQVVRSRPSVGNKVPFSDFYRSMSKQELNSRAHRRLIGRAWHRAESSVVLPRY